MLAPEPWISPEAAIGLALGLGAGLVPVDATQALPIALVPSPMMSKVPEVFGSSITWLIVIKPVPLPPSVTVELELSALIPPPEKPPMLFEHADTTSAALKSTTKVMPEVIKDE